MTAHDELREERSPDDQLTLVSYPVLERLLGELDELRASVRATPNPARTP